MGIGWVSNDKPESRISVYNFTYSYHSLEVVGKHPNQVEASTYDISRDIPVFMSVEADPDVSEEYSKQAGAELGQAQVKLCSRSYS